jgi:hypothetical protein
MKELLIRSIIGISTFLIVYLLTVFVKLSFDFSKWSEETRFFFVIFGTAFAVIASTCPLYNFKEK